MINYFVHKLYIGFLVRRWKIKIVKDKLYFKDLNNNAWAYSAYGDSESKNLWNKYTVIRE